MAHLTNDSLATNFWRTILTSIFAFVNIFLIITLGVPINLIAATSSSSPSSTSSQSSSLTSSSASTSSVSSQTNSTTSSSLSSNISSEVLTNTAETEFKLDAPKAVSLDNSKPSTCDNPKNWKEEPDLKDETNNYYTNETGNLVGCSYASKINYKNPSNNNKYQKISNLIIPPDTKTTNANKQTNLDKNYYISSGNDYTAKFHKNPNKGYSFEKDGQKFEIEKVTINDKELNYNPKNKVVISGNGEILTYPEVLPNVDLQYTLSNNGINKLLVLKNKDALKNNITKLTLKLANNAGTKSKISKKKTTQGTGATDKIQLDEVSDKILISNPYSFDSNNDTITQEVKNDKFKIDADNKLINIYPDSEYLNDTKRQFPIFIDPPVSSSSAVADTWINSANPNSNRTDSPENRGHLVVGSNAKINVNGYSTSMGTSRSWVAFDMGAIGLDKQIRKAQIRVKQYSNSGGAFNAQFKNACDTNEATVTWNTQPCFNDIRAGVAFDGYNCSAVGCGGDRWSSDIGELARINRNNNFNKLITMIVDENEAAGARGVAFCSSDGRPNHPCQNNGNQGPLLQIEYNSRPSAPIAEIPDNGDYTGNCDKSSNTGNCNFKSDINYRVSNINDGDNGNDDNARYRIFSNDLISDLSFKDISGFVGPTSGTQEKIVQTTGGIRSWKTRNTDKYDLDSPDSNTRSFTVDNGAPTETTNSQLPAFTGRDLLNPTNTTAQLNIEAPKYADNLSQKIMFKSKLDASKTFDLGGGVQADGNPVGFWYTGNTANAQYWTLENGLIKINNTNYCLDNYGVGSSIYIYGCYGGANQRWSYNSITEQLKSENNVCVTVSANVLLAGVCDSNNPNQKFQLDVLDFVRLKHTGSNKSLDSSIGGNGNLTIWDTNNSSLAQGYYYNAKSLEFRAASNPTMCLDATYSNNGDKIYAYNCHGGNNQKWTIEKATNQIRLVSNPTLCMDLPYGITNNDTIIKVYGCGLNNPNQQIAVESFQKSFLGTIGTSYNYEVSNGANTNNLGWQNSSNLQFPNNAVDLNRITLRDYPTKSLDAGEYVEGADLRINDSHTGDNQKFIYTPAFEIRSFNGMCLDAASGAVDASRLYFNNTCHGGGNQKFEFDSLGNIKMKGTNFCLNVWGAVTANQARVKMHSCDSDWNSKWAKNSLNTLSTLVDDQNYCVRVKAKDRVNFSPSGNISSWYNMGCTTIDTSLPTVQNVAIFKTRINLSQSVNITAQAKDKNISKVSLSLYKVTKDSNGANLRTKVLDIDSPNLATPYSTTDFNNINFNWNGRDNNNTIVSDGIYEVQVTATDKAGNKNIEQAGVNNYITIDNTPSNIAVTFPINNYFTNKNEIVLSGSNGTYNDANKQDKDISKLELTQKNITNQVALDANNNFNQKINLDLGTNRIDFKSTDLSGNINTKIGSPNNLTTDKLVDYWTINREATPPTLSNYLANDIQTANQTKTLVVNKLSNLSFNLSDSSVNGQLISGFKLDNNKLNTLDLNLIKTDKSGIKSTLPIIKKGETLADSSWFSGYNCAQVTVNINSEIRCVLSFKDLSTEGLYNLEITAIDQAGNEVKSAATKNIVNIQPEIYHNISVPNSPKTDTVVTTQLISGIAEQGSQIVIKNTSTAFNRAITFNNNISSNNTVPVETDLITSLDSNLASNLGFTRKLSSSLNPITITNCSLQSVQNTTKTLCNYSILINLDTATNTNITTPSVNNISVTSSLSNKNALTGVETISLQKKLDYQVTLNQYNINLSSTGDKIIFNPSGSNTAFKTITFNNKATDLNNSVLNNLTKATIKITNTTKTTTILQKDLVLTNPINGIGTLPTSYILDGKDIVGNLIPNGDYIYTLTITRAGANTTITNTTPDQLITIYNPSPTDNRTVLMAPTNNLITTRGVVGVVGITLPNSKATICLSLDGANSNSCLNTFDVNTDSTGNFNTLLNLPYSPAKYTLKAFSADKAGNITPESSIVTINLTTPDSIRGVELISSLDGLNTDNQLTCLNGGTCSLSDSNLDINSLKTLKINTKVARNTEAVQLDIIESDNVNGLSSSSNTTGLNANTLALINNQTETKAKLNPNGDSRIKTNQYNRSYTLGSTTKTISNITTLREASLVNNTNTTNTTTNTICTQEECDWNYAYPFPSYLAGGQYELRIRTYKGDSIEEITKPFSIKGIINTNPSILRLEKKVLTNECSHINKTTDVYSVLLPTNMSGCKNTENSIAKENIVNSINNVTNQATTYYTNNKYIKLYIGSDPNLKLGYRTHLISL